MDDRTRIRLRNCGLYFLFWTVFGLFLFSQSFTQIAASNVPIPWWRLLGTWVFGVYVVAMAVPVVLWLGRRYPFSKRYWLRRLALHLPLSVVWAIGELALAAVILTPLHVLPTQIPSTVPGVFLYMLVSSFHSNFSLYWEVLAVQAAFDYYRRYQDRERKALRLELHASELQAQLVEARLGALKIQLQPHFLFNTLNAIMVLVRQQKGKEAEDTIGRFSELLRCVLEDVDAQEVTLERELEYLRLYLSIEQVRFQDRLRIRITAAPDVLDAAVPQMGLQPIVENAIRHGIGRRSAAGQLSIRALRMGDMVQITVEDDGPGFSDVPATSGIGLSNTRARLQQLYGANGRLETANQPEGGAAVTMTVPYHQLPELEDAQDQVQFLTEGMVSALSTQDFEAARAYSISDRQAREALRQLRKKHNLEKGREHL